MRDIAALLFGADPAEPRDAGICDSPPAPSGDWCQTPPGAGALGWLGLTGSGQARRRPRQR